MVNTLHLAHDSDLTHLFKTISTHIIFFAVEALFAIQDGRHSSGTTAFPDLDDMSQTQNMKSHRFIVY